MVTNQPDVARGTVDRQTVEETNQTIAGHVGLDLVLACMHDDLDRCACRKPRTGLLLEAASILDISLDRSSVIIGDRWRDIDAGVAAGISTVLIDRGYGELLNALPDHIAPDLARAVEWVATELTKCRQ
jgi:D-glycero-D-manno-heptose 1,7-bisphosphate phosphatase